MMNTLAFAATAARRLDRSALLRSTAIGAVAALAMVSQAAAQPAPNARPQGCQVVAGSAAITNNPNATIILQSTNRAAIDWKSFDVGRNQSVDFRQPNSGSITLNRVAGGDPSAIAGRINANGQLVITNPSGVTFYQGSEVNAQSIVVSAAGISNQNFMAGKMVFDRAPNANARIDNRGVITVKQAGLAALVAPSVANSGVINARLGRVVLAGASVHTLDMYGDGLVSIDVSKQVRQAPVGPDGRVVTALVTNTGTIAADGGVVQLSAKAADGVVQTLVRAGGTIHANTVSNQTGAIEIAGNGGSVVIEGRLSADGQAPGTVGGTIAMAGSTATLIRPSARILANGAAGGGLIAVGTTLVRAKSSGPAPAGTSRNTIVAAGAQISADATTAGNGGRVTVLSTRHTNIAGALSARGGAAGGDGGTLELSGETGFRLTGSADTSAPHGKLGSIVLDPRDLTISTTGSPNIVPVNGDDPNIGAGQNGTTTDAFVTPAELQSLTGNIHLQATRDLTVASTVTFGNQQIFFEAGRNITVDAGVTVSSRGEIILTAASAGIAGSIPSGGITISGVLTTPDTIALNAGSNGIAIAGAINTSQLSIVTTGAVTEASTGVITTAGGLLGTASSVSLGGTGNSIPSITTPGFTTTAGGFLLVDRTGLSVGPTGTGQAGGIVVPNGQSITLQTDSLTLNGNATFPALTAPGGSVAIRPNSAFLGFVLTSGTKPGGVLALTTAELTRIDSPTLNIGQPGMPIGGPISMGGTGDLASIDFTAGQITTLGLYTTGQVTQTIGVKVGTLTGTANEVDLTRTDNSIQTIADLSTTGNLDVSTAGDLQFAGTTKSGQDALFIANGNVSVAAGATLSAQVLEMRAGGSIGLGGSISAGSDLILTAGTSGIGLTGNITAGFEVSVDTTGPVVQTAGTLSTGDLNGSAGSVLLPSRGNVVDSVGSLFTSMSSTGDFTLVDSHALTIGGSGESEGGTGLSVGSGQTITLITDQLTISGSSESGGIVVSAPNGKIAISPYTPANTIELTAGTSTPGFLSLTTAELALTQANILQLGVADLTTGALPTGAVRIATDGNLVDLGADSYTTLAFLTAGAVTQAGALGVTTITGQAGSLALPFGTDTSSNFIQNIAGFTTTAGDIALHTSSGLTVSSTVSANGGQGNVTLSSEGTVTTDQSGRNVSMLLNGSISGAKVALDSTNGSLATSGGISQLRGIVTAATLSATGGFVDFPNANVVSNLGASTAVDELLLTTVNPLLIGGSITSQTSSITLNAAGITQAAGTVISAKVLDGSSSAATVLANTGNLIRGIGSFDQSAGDFTVATASPLTFGADGGAINAATGSFTFIADAIGQNPESTFAINARNGTVTFAPLTAGRRIELIGNSGSDPNSLSITQQLVSHISANTLRLGLPGVTSSPVNIGNSADAVSLNGRIGTLDLESSGAVTEGNTGTATLTVATLTGNTGSVAMGGGNQIVTLGSYTSSGSFQLTDDSSLLVGGPIAAATSVNILSNDLLSVDGNITAPSVKLNSAGGALSLQAGTINATNLLELDSSGLVDEAIGFSITTGTLTGDSGSLNLVGQNRIGAISDLSTGAATIDDAVGLTLSGVDNFGDTSLALLPGDLVVTGSARFGNLALSVAGTVSTEGGLLTAATLTGAAGSVNLTAAAITTLGDFNTTGDFDLANQAPLTLAGNVDAANIDISTADGVREGFGQTPSPITQTGGTLTAGSITISSSDSLTQTAGSIIATGVATLSSNGPLALAGLVAGTTASLSATDKTTSFGEGGLQTKFGTVTQTTGSITAGILTGTADSYSLTSSTNAIGQLGDLTANGATPTLTLVDSQSLTVAGTVSAGDTSITLTAGDLSIPGNLVVIGNLFVSVPGVVSGGSGVSVGGTLSGNAGSLAFGGGVGVSSLGAFTSINGLTLAALGPLTVNGPVRDGVSVVLSSGGGITLAGNIVAPIIGITASNGLVSEDGEGSTFSIPGTIDQTAGTLTATNGITLTSADVFTQSSSAVVDGGTGFVSISDQGPMSLGGSISGGAVTLTATDRPADAASGQSLLPGSIAQNGGALTAATLSGSSTSTTTLDGTNTVATLGAFSSGGGFRLVDGRALSVTGNVTDTSSIGLTVTGTLGLSGAVAAPAVTLAATGDITQTAGTVQATTLTANGATVALGSAINQVGTLGVSTATGDFTLADAIPLTIAGRIGAGNGRTLTIADDAPVFAAAGQLVATAGHVIIEANTAGGGLTVGGSSLPVTADLLTIGNAQGGPVTITGTLDASGVGTLDLESAAAIVETGDGALRIGTLTGSGGSVTLGGSNDIATLGSFTSANDFSLTDERSLTLDGALNAATVTLSVTGAITQTGGSIVTGRLTGSAISAAFGSTSNAVAALGGFTTTSGFVLTNAGDLSLDGQVSASTVALNTTGAMTEDASGLIVAGTLTGSAGRAALTGSNQVGTLGTFATTGDFTLADAIPLTIAGRIAVGNGRTLTIADDAPVFAAGGQLVATAGHVILEANTAGGGLTVGGSSLPVTADLLTIGNAQGGPVTIAGTLDASGVGTLDLESAGLISETEAGLVIATELTGNAGSATLGGQNRIATLGSFATATGFSLFDTQQLSVAGTVVATTGDVAITAGALTASGAIGGGNVTLTATDGDLTQTAGTIAATGTLTLLATAGNIAQRGGTIAANLLTGTAGGRTDLTSAGNAVAALGGFDETSGFALSDGESLRVTGPLTDRSAIQLSTSGALTLSGAIQTGTLQLTAGGAITQPGGSITADSLTGSGAGVAVTQSGNRIGTLQGFASTDDFALTDGEALGIAGPVSAGTGRTLTLTDDAPTFGDGGSLIAQGGTVALREFTAGRGITLGNSAAQILQANITAATLSIGSAAGGPITIAGGFNLTNVGTLDLESAGAINETANGSIRIGTLTGAGASADLGGANTIGTLAGFSTAGGGFILVDGQSLTVAGPLTAATAKLSVTGDLTLAGPIDTQSLTLNATGAISQTGGTISAGSLTGGATTASFNSAGNSIATLAGFATTGDFALTDGRSLTVSAPLDPNTVALTVRGDLAVNSSITGGIVILNATGAITEGPGGGIFATTLSGSGSQATLNGGNQVATLSGFATQNGFAFADGGPLVVTGPLTDNTAIVLSANGPITLAGSIDASAVTLTTGSGGIVQTGGTLVAGNLNGSSAGTIDIGRSGTATIGAIGNLSAKNGIVLNDNASLQMSGTVAAPTLDLTATGALTLAGGAILTDGPSVLAVAAGPGGTATLRQTGRTTIAPLSAGRTFLAFQMPSSGGSVVLNDLNAPAADLTFSLGSGNASGVLFANNLSVFGSGGSVRFTGAVQSRSDTVAAQVSRISPQVNELYTFNGCDIAAVTCTPNSAALTFTQAAIASLLRPDILSLDQLDLSVTRDRDDPTLLLPNISNQDY